MIELPCLLKPKVLTSPRFLLDTWSTFKRIDYPGLLFDTVALRGCVGECLDMLRR